MRSGLGITCSSPDESPVWVLVLRRPVLRGEEPKTACETAAFACCAEEVGVGGWLGLGIGYWRAFWYVSFGSCFLSRFTRGFEVVWFRYSSPRSVVLCFVMVAWLATSYCSTCHWNLHRCASLARSASKLRNHVRPSQCGYLLQ